MRPLQATMAVTMTCRKVCVDAPLRTVALMYLTKFPATTRAMLAEMPIIGYTVLASFTVQTSLARVQKSTAMTTLPQSSAVQKKREYVQFSTTLMRPCRPGTMWGDTWMAWAVWLQEGCRRMQRHSWLQPGALHEPQGGLFHKALKLPDTGRDRRRGCWRGGGEAWELLRCEWR